MYDYNLFGNPVTTQSKSKVIVQNGALKIVTPYNPQFVALVKSLPASSRQFDPVNKAWLVDTQYAGQVLEWIQKVYGEDIGDIAVANLQPQTDTRILDVWYLGKTKPSGDEYIANGMNARKEWAFIFPERVLKEWFEGLFTNLSGPTLYGILGIHRNASPDDIKNAYRRMAKQWHPDICKEPGAQGTFIKIKESYAILSDPNSKARYDAGLVLEASLGKQQEIQNLGYRSPLRCGYVLSKGYERLGRFYVTEILAWRDIETENGTLTASWPAGSNEPMWVWV
jgi:hypothetical protein